MKLIEINLSRITPEQLVARESRRLKRDHEHWTMMMLQGSNDPYFPDGMNMNLTRNHIRQTKKLILEACREFDLELPAAYYLPTPPAVDNKFMVLGVRS